MIARSDSNRTGLRRQRSSDVYSEQESNDIPVVENSPNPNPNPNSNLYPLGSTNDDDDMDDENDEYLVSCRCESAKVISTLLSCLRNVAVSTGSGGKHITCSGTSHNASLIRSSHNASTYSVRSSRRNQNSTSSSSSSSSSLQPVNVYCTTTNMTFHICSTSKQIQASVDIPANLFSDYSVATTTEQDTTTSNTAHGNSYGVGGKFCINLVTLLECLHCLGTQNLDTTKLCFSYNTTQELFKLELLEELSGILSTASIPGMLSPDSNDDDDDDDGRIYGGAAADDHIHRGGSSIGQRLYSLAHAFRQSEKYVRIIIQSESLHELITELDYIAGGTIVQVTFDHQEFRMSVTGYLGECQVVLPTHGTHIISLEAPDSYDHNTTSTTGSSALNDTVLPTWTYPLHAFMESMRGLEIADETCITINRAGMMAIQHQVIQPDHTTSDVITPSFVDFILCCMVEDDDDEEEDGDDENDNDPTTTADIDGSHIAPLNVSSARLFGSLAMEDDDDSSTEIGVTTKSASKEDRTVNGVSSHRRRPHTVLETSTTVPPVHKTKKSRRLPLASNVVTSIRSKVLVHRNKDTKTRPRSDLNESDSDVVSDDDDADDDNDDDEDTEVALVLSDRASNVSSSRNRSRLLNHRRTRRTINDDDDEEDEDGSSSPELVYGQQH